MSDSQASSEVAEASAYISSLITESRIGLAIAALVLYEYIITFGDEVNLFWMRKKTGASWLFFIVRYLAMLFYVFLTAVAYAPICDLFQKVNLTLDVVQYLFWAAFSGLRALALTGMNWWVGSSAFLFACCMFGMCVWELCLGVSGSNLPILGCDGGPNVTNEQGLIVLSVLNTIQVLPFIPAFSALDQVIGYFVVVDPLTAILICRLMLSLQSAHQRALDGGTAELSTPLGQTATLRFASAVVGSIAEPAQGVMTSADAVSLNTFRDGDWARGEHDAPEVWVTKLQSDAKGASPKTPNPVLRPDSLLAYEYVITFDQEVTLFWKRKKTGATVLFLAIRYLTLLSYDFLGTATFAPMSDQKVQFVVSLCQYPFWAAFSGLRALALSRLNWPLAVVVFVLALAPLGMNLWPMILNQISGTNIPILGCGADGSLTTRQALIGISAHCISVIVSRASLIVADMLVVIVTWMSWRKGMSHAVAGMVPTLSNILMYNGTIYFLVVVICNAVHLTLTVISITTPLTQVSEATALTDPLTAILICRFLLALQHANRATVDGNTVSASYFGGEDAGGQDTLRFASVVIGSIGESLDGTDRESLEDDDALEGDRELPGSEETIEKDTPSEIEMSMPDTLGGSEERA
ncbi:uncharacterized protein TRAVEDRAFT_47251 [Trametes versicolor FP-101664 SS1]|uniref:uncharacterized protein n=1 Tax=Trametes versicolor (strain FP-101664) TaxID=717944 RepID=UPI0004624352|nr:uncharacterized protein TRAVEDRAFT_47251 [Trametes versicolor FP-101664 SS1]EIW59955.1 hypothetical protein TRAVEDRAFT_47251 [Trametes versicolor FP-101664 SS1]